MDPNGDRMRMNSVIVFLTFGLLIIVLTIVTDTLFDRQAVEYANSQNGRGTSLNYEAAERGTGISRSSSSLSPRNYISRLKPHKTYRGQRGLLPSSILTLTSNDTSLIQRA